MSQRPPRHAAVRAHAHGAHVHRAEPPAPHAGTHRAGADHGNGGRHRAGRSHGRASAGRRSLTAGLTAVGMLAAVAAVGAFAQRMDDRSATVTAGGSHAAPASAQAAPAAAPVEHMMRLGARPNVSVVVPHIPAAPAAGTQVDDSGVVPFSAATRHALAAKHRQTLARQARDRNAASSTATRSNDRQALPVGTPQQIAQRLLAQRGWSGQYGCLLAMWTRESSWNPYAQNPGSGAYGIPQALPGSKMARFGADWRTNPQTQIEWGLWYIQVSYGTPCGAWSFWQAHNYY